MDDGDHSEDFKLQDMHDECPVQIPPIRDDGKGESAGGQDDTLPPNQREAHAILAELKGDLAYSIDEIPAWYTSILLGFQHYLTMVGSTVAIPLLLSRGLCIADDHVAIAELIATMFFVSGIATLLQTTFGCRLPIVQGGTVSFLAPTFAILSVKGACPPVLSANASLEEQANRTEIWHSRIREVQGDIMVASLFQIVIGFSGGIGLMLRYIGPLAITPTITLVGLSLFQEAGIYASAHWGIAGMTIGLVVIFSQYIARFRIPFCGYSRESGWHVTSVRFFQLFPVILSILIAWIFSLILTATDVFPANSTEYGYSARTDLRMEVLDKASWFRIPYPGQWGLPTVTIAGVFGMFAGILASIVESVGDYYACARLAGAPPPPNHAVNRGIGMEGVACLIAGAIGSGNGTTSYGENIGAIGITKVGSRRVIQYGALIMICLGTFTKFGALFVMIPDPIVGGMFCALFGIVAAVGLSNLQFIDLNSSRNLFILGFSLFMGLCIPSWLKSPSGLSSSGTNADYINTGVPEFDQIVVILLQTSMFVGGFCGFVLDNTIPGTDEERGINQFAVDSSENEDVNELVLKCYELPFGMKWIRQRALFTYLPFSPTFKGWTCKCRRGARCYRGVSSRFRSPAEENDAEWNQK